MSRQKPIEQNQEVNRRARDRGDRRPAARPIKFQQLNVPLAQADACIVCGAGSKSFDDVADHSDDCRTAHFKRQQAGVDALSQTASGQDPGVVQNSGGKGYGPAG